LLDIPFTAFMTIYYIILQKEFAIARVIILIVYIILRFLQALQLAIASNPGRPTSVLTIRMGSFMLALFAPLLGLPGWIPTG
jgi:hypothetical protein